MNTVRDWVRVWVGKNTILRAPVCWISTRKWKWTRTWNRSCKRRRRGSNGDVIEHQSHDFCFCLVCLSLVCCFPQRLQRCCVVELPFILVTIDKRVIYSSLPQGLKEVSWGQQRFQARRWKLRRRIFTCWVVARRKNGAYVIAGRKRDSKPLTLRCGFGSTMFSSEWALKACA